MSRRGRTPVAPARGRVDGMTLAGSALLLAVLLVGWWAFSAAVNPLLFPSPAAVVTALVDLSMSGRLWAAGLATLITFTVSLAASIVVGIALALLVAESDVAGRVANPIATALYATPVIVLVPLVIIWFGVGDLGRMVIVFIGAVIPIYINAEAGFRSARQDLVEVARSFGARRLLTMREVIIPGATPFIMTGLKIGVGRALGGVIVAEIFLDLSGLGGLIQTSVAYLRVADMIAAALVLAVAGALLMYATSRLESHFDAWRTTR